MFESSRICRLCLLKRLQLRHMANRSFSLSDAMMKQPKEKPVMKYIGKNHHRAKRIYVWGKTHTGALGKFVNHTIYIHTLSYRTDLQASEQYFFRTWLSELLQPKSF